MKTTDLGHSAWGPRLIHHLTLLCQRLGYLKLLRKQHLRPSDTEITIAPNVPTRGYTPMGPLHHPANTDQVHHHSRNAQGNTTN
jgi:hypothetical protein